MLLPREQNPLYKTGMCFTLLRRVCYSIHTCCKCLHMRLMLTMQSGYVDAHVMVSWCCMLAAGILPLH